MKKAAKKTPHRKPEPLADDTEAELVEFSLPEIAGWPTIKEALSIKKPIRVKLIEPLKPPVKFLEKATGLRIPARFRAAFNLTANLYTIMKKRLEALRAAAQLEHANASMAKHVKITVSAADIKQRKKKVRQEEAAIMTLGAIASASRTILLCRLAKHIPGITDREMIVRNGYALTVPMLSPVLPWASVIPEKYRQTAAMTLMMLEVDPERIPGRILRGLIALIERAEGDAQSSGRTSRRAKKYSGRGGNGPVTAGPWASLAHAELV